MSVGEDGVFLVDDEFAQLSDKLRAAIAGITDQPVDFVINTHWHGDHTGANTVLAELGATVVAHDNARVRMAAPGPQQAASTALPILTFSDRVTFHFNGQTISVIHPKHAHTDGDAIIHFEEADVIHAGDVFFNGHYPRIDYASGGTIAGYIEALRTLHSLAGDNTRIIAGHGPLGGRADVAAKIQMLEGARDAVQALIDQGLSREDAVAAKPLADYEEDWAWFFIDGDRMTAMLYEGLVNF
jgi:glyoxylase-like metal-dependent hydrolase (beta-lactamase superfamily II)